MEPDGPASMVTKILISKFASHGLIYCLVGLLDRWSYLGHGPSIVTLCSLSSSTPAPSHQCRRPCDSPPLLKPLPPRLPPAADHVLRLRTHVNRLLRDMAAVGCLLHVAATAPPPWRCRDCLDGEPPRPLPKRAATLPHLSTTSVGALHCHTRRRPFSWLTRPCMRPSYPQMRLRHLQRRRWEEVVVIATLAGPHHSAVVMTGRRGVTGPASRTDPA
jgi:hypothetical protein